ncbi:unnamed protein product [Phytophthora fragariaefolia]|uniref:Unnamed protein product n=1 Tax=Phytophthora fragariaefolia TaxID=1490495 RepID=A0A9W6XZS5_9STRA|nr:unnamed protein product [Phytophthora fragariaefolia]
MRSSRRKKHTTPADPAMEAHDIDFRHLWRQLKSAGWKSKRPTGIQTDWTYTSPKNDVLVGERAAVEYVFQSGLLVDAEDDLTEARADDADEHLEDEHCSSDYEDISCRDESDGAAIADDDLDCGGDEFDEEDDELSDSDVVEMDQAFLSLLHVGGISLSKAALDERENTLRAMEWTAPSAEFETDNTPRYMSRDRCNNILRDLHFVDNTVDHSRDKMSKLRPVADKIQERFLSGWSLPAIFSFDELVLPATLRRNPSRMFMSDKPHRYGSKLFMLCDAKTVLRGQGMGGDNGIDFKSGAAAVVRKLSAAFTPESRHNWHAVVVDRLYSSVLLAVELLKMNVFVVGTIQTNRLGFNKAIQPKHKTRPASSVMTASTIERKIKHVGALHIGCPQSVNDYSLQMSTRFTKYYKALFLGLLDLALVNTFLSHKEAAKIKVTVAMPRAEWFVVLQDQLLQLKAEDFAGVQATPPASCQKRRRTPVRLTHALQ